MPRSLFTLAAPYLLTIIITSCATSSPPQIEVDDAMTVIEITDTNPDAIRRAVIETFLANGYQRESIYGLVFEKRGNIVRQLEYASYMGGSALTRVKIRIDPISANSHLVKADAFIVTGKYATLEDNEKPVRGPRKRHYKNLLEEVRERLKYY